MIMIIALAHHVQIVCCTIETIYLISVQKELIGVGNVTLYLCVLNLIVINAWGLIWIWSVICAVILLMEKV